MHRTPGVDRLRYVVTLYERSNSTRFQTHSQNSAVFFLLRFPWTSPPVPLIKHPRTAFGGCTLVPVSYTHLDVYKRQGNTVQTRSNQSKLSLFLVLFALSVSLSQSLSAQLPDPSALAPSTAPNPLSDTTVNPGKVLLFDLEAKFAKDVLARGGAAFADWFAEDGVALNNGQAPLIGRVAILKSCLLYTSRCV